MKNKLNLIASFIIVTLTSYANQNLPSINTKAKGDIKAKTSEVLIDLNTETIIAPDGVNIKQGNMELRAFNLRRDKKNNKIYVNGDLKALFLNPTGNLYIESIDGGNIDIKTKDGVFYKNFGYLDVSSMTGAMYPNQNIYFGGDKIVLNSGNLYINNGWFTTDYNIKKTKNPKDAGYNLLSKEIIIEPDKQVTLKYIDFMNGDKKRTLIPFLWYRANIRSGSEVPLFPEWKTSTEYGFSTSMGMLYGDKNSKLRGGISPRFADAMGWLIGRSETWYTDEKFGTTKLNIDDFLVHSKAKKISSPTIGERMLYEQRRKRHKISLSQEYSGAYGNLYLNMINATYNMVPKLNDIIVDYTNNSRFNEKTRPNLMHTINFYVGDINLHEKDISLKSKVKLTNNKKAYGLMVYDDINDISYGSSIDHDLISQVSLYKDNKNYKIGGYYDYLYDVDPGSNINDTQSRAENFGFIALDKNNNIGFKYDEKNGDTFRPLGIWERDPSNESKVSYKGYSKNFKFDYIPTTVREYKYNNSKDLNLYFGKYEISNDLYLTPGYSFKTNEKSLDLSLDSARNVIERNNLRSKEFNRFNDTIYSKTKEQKIYFDINSNTIKAKLNIGKQESLIHDRTGIYASNNYKIYENNSKFYEIYLEKNKISLDKLGFIGLNTGVRYDKYDKNNDKTIRYDLGINHLISFNNLENELSLNTSKYHYSKGNKNLKDIRLKNKEDLYKIKDKIKINLGDYDSIYIVSYEHGINPTTHKKSSQKIKQNLDIKKDDKKLISLMYDEDKKFNDVNINHENYNNYTYRNYGATYYLDNHSFSYNGINLNNRILDLDPSLNNGINIDNFNEKIKTHSFGYLYKFDDNKINLNYSFGTDKRLNEKTNIHELDVKNQVYNLGLTLSKDKISNIYNVKYETFNHREKGARNLVIDKKRYNSSNSDILTLNYEYQDENLSDFDLRYYAATEYNKDKNEVTYEEIQRIRNIIEKNNTNYMNFNLNNNIYSKFDDMGAFKKNLKLYLKLEKNDAKYRISGNYLDSLKQAKAGIFYSQNRIGFGYEIEENSSWKNKKFTSDNREHKLSFVSAIGKPSQAYTIKTYAKFYENLNEKIKNSKNRKKSLDGLGVELGREMDYYKWTLAFERRYVLARRDYEWRGAIEFTLLTFPDKSIFGVGAKKKIDKKIKPTTSLFNGIKVKDAID